MSAISLSSVWKLRSITSMLINSFRPSATDRQCILVNDVPEDIYLDADREVLAKVIGELLQNLLHQAKGSCIRITAKVYSDVVLLHIKDDTTRSTIKLNNHVQALAERMGGFVGVHQRLHVNTISFSFPNLPLRESNLVVEHLSGVHG